MDMAKTENIENTLPSDLNKNEQKVVSVPVKSDVDNKLNIVKKEINNEIIQKKDESLEPEKVLIKTGKHTLNSLYSINVINPVTLEGRVFGLKIPECGFTKFLNFTEVEGKRFLNRVAFDSLFYKEVSDLVQGVHIGVNSLPAINTFNFFHPAVSNVILVTGGRQATERIDLGNLMDIIPDIPGEEITPEIEAQLMAEYCIYDHMSVPAVPYQYMGTSFYGGLSTVKGNRPFVFRVEAKPLWKSDLGYLSELALMYQQINHDPKIPKVINQPFDYADYKVTTDRHRQVIEFLFNQGMQETLIFSPILDQLKLALYSDMFATIQDMIEGYSQMSPFRMVYDSSVGFGLEENNNDLSAAGREVRLMGCTWPQWVDYNMGRIDIEDEWDGEWYFLPIKKAWLRTEPEALVTLLLGVFPYPIGVLTCPVGYSIGGRTEVDDDQHFVNFPRYHGYLEHLGGRVLVGGHSNICLLMLDSDDATPDDPTDRDHGAEYFDYWQIDFGGVGPWEILNLFSPRDPNHPNNVPTCHNQLFRWLVQYYILSSGKDTLSLLRNHAKLTKWEIYHDIFNLVALLTTMNDMSFRNRNDYDHLVPPLKLCNLCSPVRIDEAHAHLHFGWPSTVQRIYAYMGFVKQKGSDFIFDMNELDFREMMMAKRYGVATIKAYILEGSRNQVRSEISHNQGDDIHRQTLIRKQQVMLKYDSFLDYIPEMAGPSNMTRITGCMDYLVSAYIQQDTGARFFTVNAIERNEYSGLLDWANIMQSVLVRPNGTKWVINYSLTDGNHVVQCNPSNKANAYWFIPIKNSDESADQMLKFMNDAFGRSLLTDNDARRYLVDIRWMYAKESDRVAFYNYEFWQPVWKTGECFWNGDLNRQHEPRYSYPSVADNDTNFTSQLPSIRCLDYPIPWIATRTLKPLMLVMGWDMFFRANAYVNLDNSAFSGMVNKDDRVNRQLYEALK